MKKTFVLGFLAIFSIFFWLFFSSATIAADFEVHKDGIVTDNATGLSWQRSDDNIKRDWKSAIEYCLNLSFAGYDDWRLPNQYDLGTLRGGGGKYPDIDQDIFPTTKADKYWSNTEMPYYEQKAFYVGFGKETLARGSKEKLESLQWDKKYFSRCVRGKRKKVQKK